MKESQPTAWLCLYKQNILNEKKYFAESTT